MIISAGYPGGPPPELLVKPEKSIQVDDPCNRARRLSFAAMSPPASSIAGSSFLIKRNCSLSPRAALAALGVAAAVLAVIGAVFAWVGAWLILPFAGLEIAALAAAFYVNGRHAGDYERFVFGGRGEELLVEVRDAARVRRYRFNPRWASVVVRAGRSDVQVAIVSHGRALHIGRHADDAGRRVLARALGDRFAQSRR